MGVGAPLPVRHTYAPIRWFFISSLTLVILKVCADLLAYPAVITTAGGLALTYLLLFALALLIYSWFALVRTRDAASPRIALQQGTVWGLLCGGAWMIELSVANLNPLAPQLGWLFRLIYASATGLGFLLPGLAGMLVAWRSKQLHSGIEAGLLCGMLGGLVIFLTYTTLSVLLLHVGQQDPQIVQEFQRSGLTDLSTYIVGDYLAAMVAHLWIGLLTGVGFGALGSVIGIGLGRVWCGEKA